MAAIKGISSRAFGVTMLGALFYLLLLIAFTHPWLQRQILYVHNYNPTRWTDINNPEQYRFAKNQITPFNFTTLDHETIYAWHVLPLGLYAKHEADILRQSPGFADDITKTKAFHLLRNEPDSRLIIIFHGNAGTVAQGWRTDSYRALAGGSTTRIHILAIDYRGFGLSTGFPTENGVITDGIAAVDWALRVAQVPAASIALLGQSLGTGVASAVAEHFAYNGIDFAGIILIAGFASIPDLLPEYSIVGILPILWPIKLYPRLRQWFNSHVLDQWSSAARLANLSELLFAVACNASTDGDIEIALWDKLKARSTVSINDDSFIRTCDAGRNKIIREQIVLYGQHSRIVTYVPVALAALRAFDLDNRVSLP